ncbi:MAG: DNA repair protein RadC [Bacteroidales bacterium]|nr:DNA repair protein RadC [Bacteroidales bacterium]
MKLTIKDWAEDDRPREKLQTKGKQTLSDAELLAIIIGSGTPSESAVDVSKKILKASDNNLFELGKKSIQDLCTINGIGPAKAISIISALELGKRHKLSEVIEKKKISDSNDVYELFYPFVSDKQHEEFWVAFLNRANKVIATNLISVGTTSGTLIDVKIIMKKALEYLACSLLLCHNHPSGSMKASKEDENITAKIVEAARFFDIAVLDHIIVGNGEYFSFADNSLI